MFAVVLFLSFLIRKRPSMDHCQYSFVPDRNKASSAFFEGLILIAACSIFSYPLFGFAVIIAASVLSLTKDGVIIDLANKQIKRDRIFKGRALSAWKPLPAISYISIFNPTLTCTANSISGRSVVMRQKTIMVNLIYQRNKKITVCQTFSIFDALQVARLFSEALNVRIYDATTRTWL